MDFAFSEEQEFLRSTAREFLQRECPMSAVRELMEHPAGYRPELWKRMAELGWHGLIIPEAYGGAGLGLVDLIVIVEELGRALTPSPFFANLLGTLALLQAGNETQKKDLLPQVAAGDRILSFAITEASGSEDAERIETRATRDGDRFRLDGLKLFVPDAQNADTIVVAARTGPVGEGGISLLLVERDAPGLSITPLQSIDQTRRIAELRFEGTPAALLGEENGGWKTWEQVRSHALVALSVDALGGAAKVLEDSVEYAKQREQFGKPIGVNQAVKHQCADMLVAVEGARAISYHAAWAVSEAADDAQCSASMAKAFTGDAYRENSAQNIQIHGGVGFTWEYDCHLYYKRARALEVTYGDPAWHRERVAQLMNL